jgi:hypothetical protein
VDEELARDEHEVSTWSLFLPSYIWVTALLAKTGMKRPVDLITQECTDSALWWATDSIYAGEEEAIQSGEQTIYSEATGQPANESAEARFYSSVLSYLQPFAHLPIAEAVTHERRKRRRRKRARVKATQRKTSWTTLRRSLAVPKRPRIGTKNSRSTPPYCRVPPLPLSLFSPWHFHVSDLANGDGDHCRNCSTESHQPPNSTIWPSWPMTSYLQQR